MQCNSLLKAIKTKQRRQHHFLARAGSPAMLQTCPFNPCLSHSPTHRGRSLHPCGSPLPSSPGTRSATSPQSSQPLTGRPRPRPRRPQAPHGQGKPSPPHPAEPPRPSGRVPPCPERPSQPVPVPLRLDQRDRGAPGEHGGASTTAPLKVSAPAARLRSPAGIRFQGAAAISGGGGSRSGTGIRSRTRTRART